MIIHYDIKTMLQFRFSLQQSLSSFLLIIACLFFDDKVDGIYKYGAWCNAIVSVIYNGIQKPYIRGYQLWHTIQQTNLHEI